MQASDNRTLNTGNVRENYYGLNDTAYDAILDSYHFTPIGIKKW
jgi:hypothetical protein